MAKPSNEQSIVLSQLQDEVLEQMKTIGFENESRLNSLNSIPLAVLRRNATQRHGVTRFRRGANASELKTEDVETVDLHPMLLDPSWHDYARFVLYHEYLHALGNRFHDTTFRRLEQLWPHHGTNQWPDGSCG